MASVEGPPGQEVQQDDVDDAGNNQDSQLAACLQTLRTSTNPLFALQGIVEQFCATYPIVAANRHRTREVFMQMCHKDGLDVGSLAQRLGPMDLAASFVARMFLAIDLVSFGGCVTCCVLHYSAPFYIRFYSSCDTADIFTKTKRITHFRVVGTDEMTRQIAKFSRSGIHHYISMCQPYITDAFAEVFAICSLLLCHATFPHRKNLQKPIDQPVVMCGVECIDRLAVLQTALENVFALLVGTYSVVC